MEVINAEKSPLNNSLDVIWHPHPVLPAFNRAILPCVIQHGSTVREVLLSAGIDTKQPIIISLDDRLLTVEEWDILCPVPGQMLNVQATVMGGGGGGGGGSNPLQVVAMVALVVVVSYFTAGAGAGLIGLTAGSATALGVGAVAMMAGSMLINAVFQASNPSTSTNDSSGVYSAPSPTYSLSGGSNRARPYESMPVVFGVNRFFPDLASKPFLEYQGEDQYLYQIFHLGLSTCNLTDFKIGTTLVSNYQNVTWNYPDQNGKISAFPGNVDSIAGGDLTNAVGWVTRTTSANTYRIGIDVEGVLYYANNGGGLDNTSVQLRVEYRPVGSATWIAPNTITTQGSGFVAGRNENYSAYVEQGEWQGGYAYDGEGYYYTEFWADTSYYETRSRYVTGNGNVVIVSGSSQAPKRATLFIDVAPGTYEVRVIRDTGDTTDARLQNKTGWSALKSYQLDSSNYVGQNRRALTIRASAQLNGTISQLSVNASANANYWNGSAWVFGETSNPAHWFMDFARGRRDGAGKLMYGVGLSDSQIDLAALSSWASFCATENLTFNAVLDGQQTAADILSAVARCGFASPTWASGKLGVVWDARNASPVAAFGMSNIIRNSFEVSYITEQLAEEIIVRFVNPDKDWVQDEVRVLVPGVTSPQRSATIDLLGCTSASMAGKFANYFAAQQYYRTRRIQWDCDFEGFVCQRGDVVLLSHDLTQWGYSGRVVSRSGNTITLDREVPRSGTTDYLMLKKPDGTMTTYSVTSASGNSNTLTLTTAPSFDSSAMDMDHIWFFSPLPTPGKKVKILSIQPSSESLVTIVATDEDPAFYAAWDGSWTAPATSTLLLNSTPVISNVTFKETLYKKSAGIFSNVSISFNVSGTYDHASIRYRINNGSWLTGRVDGSSFDFDVSDIGLLEVSLTPISFITIGSPVIASTYIYGVSLPPSNVEQFTIANSNVAWSAVNDVDVIGYEIRWNSAGDLDWNASQALHEGFITASPWSLPYTISGGALLIKAVDIVGNRSSAPASITLPSTTIYSGNVFESQSFGDTGWPGEISGGVMTPGGIIANSLDPEFWPADNEQFWQGDTDQFWKYGYSDLTYICKWTPSNIGRPVNITLLADYVGTGGVQYRRAGTNNAWLYWPGSIVAESGGYEFKVTVSGGKTQGRINAFSVFSSTTPTILYFNDLVINNTTGTRLPIGSGWYGMLGIKLTVQSDGNGASYALTVDKSLSGPLIKCYNPSGIQVQGLIDAEVRVY